MYNYWSTQVRVREAVNLVQQLLNDEYLFTLSTPYEWKRSYEELIDTIYFNDILVQAGLNKYMIVPQLDKFGLVIQLTLVEK
jgi:hypothetical protein